MRLVTFLFGILLVLLNSKRSIAFQEPTNLQYGKHSLIEFFIEIIATNNNTGSSCINDVSEIIKGFQQKNIWALKIIDSSGQFGTSNFMLGYNHWLGSKINCDAAYTNPNLPFSPNSKRLHTILNSLSPFPVQYKVFIINFSSEYQMHVEFDFITLIHLGLCIPSTCSDSLMKTSLETYFSRHNVIMDTIKINEAEVVYTKDLKLSSKIFQSRAFYIFSTILFATLILTFFAEFRKEKFSKNNKDSRFNEEQIINCFSISENTNTILSASAPPNSILCVNGLRTISYILVIIMHVNIFSKYALNSVMETAFFKVSFLHNLFMFGVITTDWFFVISAYITVFNFMKNDKLQAQILSNSTRSNIWLYMKLVLNRYFRLTPLLIMYLLTMRLAYLYLDDVSPMDVKLHLKDFSCVGNWWKNLLYIQNFLPYEKMCGGWMWYLGNDLQYFMLILAIMFAYAKHPKLVKILFVLFAIACVVIQFSINYIVKYSFNFDVMMDNFNHVYAKPWMRISPYNAGAFMGYLAFKFHKNPPKIGFYKLCLLWFLVITFVLSPVLSHDNEFSKIPVWQCSLMFSVVKFIYGLAIGLLIWLCHSNNGGPINRFLSHKKFIHLGKLSYGMYLVHPIIIVLIFGFQQLSINLTNWSAMGVYAVVLSYFVNIVYSVFFELPYQRLSNYLFK